MSARHGVALLLALAATACGADERIGGGGGPTDVGLDGSTDAPAPDAGPPIRSVTLRNPFGSAAPDNLLVDGDFELTSASGQFGWRAVAGGGEAPLVRETGGLCRSGVTCGVLTPEADLIALAAGPGAEDIEVVVWAKPPTVDCTLTVVSLIQCTSPIVVNAADVSPTSTDADAGGWCEYRVVAPPNAHRPCLFVSSFDEAGTRTLVDAASLTGVAPGKPRSVRAGPPRAEILTRASRAVRALADSTRFGRPQPTRP